MWLDQLDLSELTRQYAGRGSQAHHPAVLLSLLIYGHATGVFSSCKIERATHDSVAFRYLAANTHPDHHTIASFHCRFLPQFEAPVDDPIRADTVCAAQANGGTGIRHNQKSDELEAVLPARAGQNYRRVDIDYVGVEREADERAETGGMRGYSASTPDRRHLSPPWGPRWIPCDPSAAQSGF